MTTEALNTWKNEAAPLLFALLIILTTATGVGKQAISWILMKLYEIFIQRNPVRI